MKKTKAGYCWASLLDEGKKMWRWYPMLAPPFNLLTQLSRGALRCVEKA